MLICCYTTTAKRHRLSWISEVLIVAQLATTDIYYAFYYESNFQKVYNYLIFSKKTSKLGKFQIIKRQCLIYFKIVSIFLPLVWILFLISIEFYQVIYHRSFNEILAIAFDWMKSERPVERIQELYKIHLF